MYSDYSLFTIFECGLIFEICLMVDRSPSVGDRSHAWGKKLEQDLLRA